MIAPIFSFALARILPPLLIKVLIVGFVALCICLVLLVSILIIRRIWKIRWRDQEVVHSVRLRNSGNINSPFQVNTLEPQNQIDFKILLDGLALEQTPVEEIILEAAPVQIRPQPVSAQAQPADQRAILPVAQPTIVQAPANGSGKKLSQSAAAAGEAANNVAGFTGVIVDILITLGGLIPGPLGKTLFSQGSAIRTKATTIKYKVQQPKQQMMKVKKLQRCRIPSKSSKEAAKAPQKSGGQPIPIPAVEPQAAQTAGSAPFSADWTAPGPVSPSRTERSYAVQLPSLAPAGEAILELRMNIKNQFKGGEFRYWLFTRQLAAPTSLPPVKTVHSVTIRKVPRFYWYLSLFLSIGVLVFNSTWVALAVQWVIHLELFRLLWN